MPVRAAPPRTAAPSLPLLRPMLEARSLNFCPVVLPKFVAVTSITPSPLSVFPPLDTVDLAVGPRSLTLTFSMGGV